MTQYPEISFRDLLNVPQKYSPLGSVKSVRDLENPTTYVKMDMNKLFLQPSNCLMLARQLFATSKENGGRANLTRFIALVKELQPWYVKQHDLKNFIMNEDSETGQQDWVLSLQAINNQFLKHCYNQLQWNKYVPFREKTLVGPYDDRRLKELKELTAQDIPTVDVWAQQDINRTNKDFRSLNEIPPWQYTMNRRHYDRGNEGLHSKHPDRASLNTPVYGFDQTTTFNALDNWTRTGWFGY